MVLIYSEKIYNPSNFSIGMLGKSIYVISELCSLRSRSFIYYRYLSFGIRVWIQKNIKEMYIKIEVRHIIWIQPYIYRTYTIKINKNNLQVHSFPEQNRSSSEMYPESEFKNG